MGGHKGNETCDARAAMVFLIGLAAGTGCTITSKMLFQMSAPNSFGTMQKFTPPLFQTWVMFVGMAFALPAHYFAEWRRRANATAGTESNKPPGGNNNKATQAIPGIHTLAANLMARIWNAANDLQNVATLGVAKPVARKWARNLLDS